MRVVGPFFHCRPLGEADRDELGGFLARRLPENVYLQHLADTRGTEGFVGAFEERELRGVVVSRGGAISAAAGTDTATAERMVEILVSKGPWSSVVGPEEPCGAIASVLAPRMAPRVNRVQVFMAADRGSDLGPDEPDLRPATRDDVASLVPVIAAYRVEDRLAQPGDDQTAWIRAHTAERVESEQMYVMERDGRIVFTGAFTFLGPSGAGIGGVYTLPHWRGRGIGCRATATLCRIALETGPYVTLHAAHDNANAVRCYEKAGMRVVGEFRLAFR